MGENKNPRYAAVMDFGEHGIATYPVHGDTYQPKGKLAAALAAYERMLA